jgi:hypothetical protein
MVLSTTAKDLRQLSGFLPGDTEAEKGAFIQTTFTAATAPITAFIENVDQSTTV